MKRLRGDQMNQRSDKAQALQAKRNLLTPQQQLAVLDKRLGEGVDAEKERTRLAKQIADAKPKTKETKEKANG